MIWHNVKTADFMREDAVQSAISEQNHTARPARISLPTAQETALVSHSARTAASIPAVNALNAIAVHTRRAASAVSVRSANNQVGITKSNYFLCFSNVFH